MLCMVGLGLTSLDLSLTFSFLIWYERMIVEEVILKDPTLEGLFGSFYFYGDPSESMDAQL